MKTLLTVHKNLRLVGRRLFIWSWILGLTWALWGCSGDRAPESTFVLLNGSKVTSKQLQGKVALVNFWATSCTTCVAEMPELVATYNKFKDRGYVTLGVAIDNTGTVAREWGDIQLTPTTFLVNKQGEIVKRFVGTPDFAELHKLIEKLLAET
jgi:peroxiredoxin